MRCIHVVYLYLFKCEYLSNSHLVFLQVPLLGDSSERWLEGSGYKVLMGGYTSAKSHGCSQEKK